ncbi:galactokinase [Conchiformibius kuhniae]|uniref:Galactokinase n=1 Tax=Conchiformibius kuhniae TaxID=211502 RepID=A0A8T9MY96_9NEIS|nr:galactokinase [Conchiformibius kuhniae]UOP04833.1 galactokinase [Conchiformibius kuhniae]
MNTLAASFRQAFRSEPALLVRAPGRVNLIGEHTDYNDGFVLPCAIDFAATVAVAPNGLGRFRVYAADYAAHDEFPATQLPAHSPQTWANYVRAVVWAFAQRGLLPPHGADMAVGGNVPQGAGLSSSAALQVGVAKALQTLYGWDGDATALAQLAQAAENGFVGCRCGIMDQLASARGRAGHALLIDCRSLETEAVPLPQDWRVMIVHSNVQRGLVGSEYNLRRQQCETAARHFGVAALRDLDEAAFEAGKRGLDATVARRARYIIRENRRTLDAAEALRRNDAAAVSRLMAQSHAGMRDEFEITHPAVDTLVALLNDVAGTHGGARMTGGGFGGCVVALLPQALLAEARQHLAAHYHARTGLREQIFVCTPQNGAAVLPPESWQTPEQNGNGAATNTNRIKELR